MDRRTFLAAGGAGVAAMNGGNIAQAQTARGRIVLVHGSWHGGWCWSPLKPLLEAAGYIVTAPTLTGVGERRHLIARSVNLDTHIQDVVQHIENEEIGNAILVGHSYGGFVVTGATEILRERIAQLVLLDAFFPRDGERLLDYAPPDRRQEMIDAAARDQSWNIPPLPVAAFGVSDPALAAWVGRRLCPHPVGTYLQPIREQGAVMQLARRSYISCDAPALPVLDGTRQRVKGDPAWQYVGLQAPHDVMVSHPTLLADTLLGLIA
jgi:pimeloyl-ACP methyl ester carboxylesterase